ncbi:hypothetical protein ACHAWU_010377 [Discostella pseudostelligera]|uniref:Sulfotransferase n=1 Tax=Discostella pseudostelligera TaxID=259834 RepID=A0ABD3MT91_9STRA
MLPNYIIKTPRNEPLKFTKRNNDERMRRSSGMEEDEALSSAPPANSSTTPSSSKTFIDQFIDRSHRITIPDNTRKLAFIHIGKSGGSTISILLRNGCMSAVDGIPCESNRFMKIPNQVEETIASKRILFYLHTPHADKDNMTQYYQRINSVVVVARDPMERFISAFLSRHPVNIEMIRKRNRQIRTLAEAKGIEPPVWAKTIWGSGDTELDQECRAAYNGCFPTLEDLAMCAADPRMMLMMDEEEETITTSNGKMYNTIIQWRANRKKHSKEVSFNCSELCRDIMTGKNRYIQHVRNNYDAFLKDLPTETEVFVLRTTKIWEDWVDVNNILGATKNVVVPEKGSDADVVNARGKLPVRNNLSPRGQRIICHFLKNDIRVYIGLLNRAVNLSNNDVRDALEVIHRHCPLILSSLVEGGAISS